MKLSNRLRAKRKNARRRSGARPISPHALRYNQI
jgi:hypothetical protein